MAATRGEIIVLSGLTASLLCGLVVCFLSWNHRVAANRPIEPVIERFASLTPRESSVKGLPLPDPTNRPARILDINRATLEELDALPGLGKTLAQRILDFRASRGGIRTIDELGAVEGLSPKKLAQLAPMLTTIATEATVAPRPVRVNLNRATFEELDALPGIGPTLAAAIIETRKQKGGFRSIEDLQDVPGLGEATWLKFADLVEFP